MAQRSVEQVIGRLATDEELRRRFEEDRDAVIQGLLGDGLILTAVEIAALRDLSAAAVRKFARRLDARLQKVSLKRHGRKADAAPKRQSGIRE